MVIDGTKVGDCIREGKGTHVQTIDTKPVVTQRNL